LEWWCSLQQKQAVGHGRQQSHGARLAQPIAHSAND